MIRWPLLPLSLISCALLHANPKGMDVVQGNAYVGETENALHVIADHKTEINWESFSIGQGEITRFALPGKNSVVFNRVVGGETSEILGSLSSNGQVYLINPHGIYIGEGAEVNVASFIASTFDVLGNALISNDTLSFKGDSKATIQNFGKVKAACGDVFLLAYQVKNSGEIKAPSGQVGLGAATEILLKPSGNRRIYIKPSKKVGDKEGVGIENSGSIEAIQTELQADGNPYLFAIKNDGDIDALQAEERDGAIYLVGMGARVEQGGKLLAPSGNIHILGDEIILHENAHIDVSSGHRAGTVLVGGDTRGNNKDVPNARLVYTAQGATIDANSRIAGNGGKIVLWGDETNLFYGSASAKGGENSGDGGFIEISSHGSYAPNGFADTTAPNGKTGELLLDPSTIIISGDADKGVIPVPLPYTFSKPVVNINAGQLTTFLQTNNVTVDGYAGEGGDGSITVTSPLTWNSGGANATSLTLLSPTRVNIENLITIQSTAATPDQSVLKVHAPIINIGLYDAGVTPGVIATSGNIDFSSPKSNSGALNIFSTPTNAALLIAVNGDLRANMNNIYLTSMGTTSPVVALAANGNVEFNARNDIALASKESGSTLIQSNNQDVTLLAGKHFSTDPNGIVQSFTGNVTIASDHNGTRNSGDGTFSHKGIISALSGDVKLHTTHPASNHFSGIINGAPFIPTGSSENSETEQWEAFHPHPFIGSTGLTLFYKSKVTPHLFHQAGVLDAEMVGRIQRSLAFWEKGRPFTISYDQKLYRKKHRIHNQKTSYDVYKDEVIEPSPRF